MYMKKLLPFLTIILIGFASTIQAQTWQADSINMNPGVTSDVFYSLNNGSVKTESNSNWILALGTSQYTAAIWANHTAGVRVFRTGKNVSQWSTITLADTALESLINPDTSWDTGALNAKAASAFDYGWGTYNTTTHNVYGDSIFIVAQANNFYQFVVDSMDGTKNDYYVRIAPVGMAQFTAPYTFAKAPKYTNSNFMYITAGMQGLKDTVREPAKDTWDLLFTNYIGTVALQGGGTGKYPVKGVLANRGTKTARIQVANVDTIATTYGSYPLNMMLSNIGSDWKIFNGAGYDYPQDLTYLVEAKDGSLWQMKFNGYSTASGKIKFDKRKLGAPLAINDVENNVASFGVYPNPIQDATIVSVDAKASANAILSVIDLQGKVVISRNFSINAGLNALQLSTSTLQTGNYLISIKGNGLSAAQMISKK